MSNLMIATKMQKYSNLVQSLGLDQTVRHWMLPFHNQIMIDKLLFPVGCKKSFWIFLISWTWLSCRRRNLAAVELEVVVRRGVISQIVYWRCCRIWRNSESSVDPRWSESKHLSSVKSQPTLERETGDKQLMFSEILGIIFDVEKQFSVPLQLVIFNWEKQDVSSEYVTLSSSEHVWPQQWPWVRSSDTAGGLSAVE